VTEQSAEGLAKTTVRFESVCHGHLVEVGAATQPFERAPQPVPSGESVKGHAVALLEVAPGAFGLDPRRAQVLVADALLGSAFHATDQLRRPFRVGTGQLERPAALAGAESREQRVLHGSEELDVTGERLPRGTGRPAEDAGGPHAEKEHAVVAASRPGRPVHLGDRRQEPAGVS
jgi:hypothetical protein